MANKVFDFNKYKKEQASALDRYNKLKAENDLEQAEAINYVDDLNLHDVRENKNASIAAKKISDKYRKIHKRKTKISNSNIWRFQKAHQKKKKVDKICPYYCKKHIKEVQKPEISLKKMKKEKEFKKAKNLFDALKVDPSSVLFSEEILDKKLMNKLKKSNT